MGVRFTTKLVSQWTPATSRKLDLKVFDLATRIHRDAMRYAPVLTGNLVASGRVMRKSAGSYQIVFGGGRVPYALRRHYENRAHPSTLRYLERAGNENSRRFISELRSI